MAEALFLSEAWIRCPRCGAKVVLFLASSPWNFPIQKPFRHGDPLQARCSKCAAWFETDAKDWNYGAAIL